MTTAFSSFSAQSFSPAGRLSGVDPARLPTSADVRPGFEGPAAPVAGYNDVADGWDGLHLNGLDRPEHARRATLVHLAALCEAAGMRFGDDVKAGVADALGLAPDAPERTAYSAFGTEVQFARVYLKRVDEMRTEARAWLEGPMNPRQRLKALRLDDRRVSAVRVLSVQAPKLQNRGGETLAVRPAQVVLSGRCSGLECTFSLSARAVQQAREAQLAYTHARNALADTDGVRPTRRRPVGTANEWTRLL